MDLSVPHGTPEAPERHEVDPFLRFIDLGRDEDRWTPRLRLPGNVPADALEDRAKGEMYWSGLAADWEDLAAIVAAGRAPAVLVERSGVVVLDCDVRHLGDAGFVVREPGRAVWGAGSTQYGEQDLYRAVRGLGQVLPRTWTVSTKSGGRHFYFRAPSGALRSSGHRKGWAVDVKASPNAWVVAPPTPGYAVVDDSPIATLPDWLAAWLRDELPKTEPLGGRERTARGAARREEYLDGIKEQVSGRVLGESMGAVVTRWRDEVLLRVREANMYGGWNQEIYNAACLLDEAGHSHAYITGALLAAAKPWDERERRAAERTIASALGRAGGGR
jgi:hypothetical protein